MILDVLLDRRGMTKEQLSAQTGVPCGVVEELCSGRAKLEDCGAQTVEKMAQALGVPARLLEEDARRSAQRERAYEYGLPGYLQDDLDAYKEGLAHGSRFMDCLWCELYGSINAAQITDGVITAEHADYLRQKFLWGRGQ